MAYGVCFGLMNDKAAVLTDRLRALPFRVRGEGEDRTTFFDRMLACPYCTGFHCGWLVWLGLGADPVGSWGDVPGTVLAAVVWSFASASFCYVVDTAAQRLESPIR